MNFFKKVILCCTLGCATYVTNGQTITTFAGNGTAGFGGDGGSATSAQINGPGGLAFDGAGNTYITSYFSNNIRKVSASGIITTIAGTGTAGSGGDGGPATSAQFTNPVKLAMDTSGNLYVADMNNNKVRKISASGIITTFAGTGTGGYSGDGGPATSANMFHPSSLYIAKNGDVYISDYSNNRIRKVSPSGTITTVAGNGTAGSSGDGGPAAAALVNQPWGIAGDTVGNIYFADASNNKVRRISTTGIISTFAGTGASGSSGDGGLATAAQLSNPTDIAFDNAGNTYIMDQYNNKVRKVSAAGIITVFAGNGTAGYAGDGGLATLAQINGPNEIEFSPSGDLFIADNSNNRVRKILNTTSIHVIADDAVHIYPNPVTNLLQIKLVVAAKGHIQLINQLGQIISEQKLNDKNTNIDMKSLPSGIYLVKIEIDGNVVYKRVFKQ